MDNLINDIRNVFNNSGSKNQPILKQGKQFIRYADDYVKVVKPELKIIQQTTSPKLKSIVETLESTNSLSQTNKVPVSNVSQFESEFNRTLVEYSNAYKSFMQELLNKTQTQKKVNQFFGKAVSSADGNYAYVNDFGYTHRYSNDAWLKNDPSCPNTVSPISADDFKSLVQGPDMGLGQACKIAGQNIQNTDTEEVAWVDIKGYKHIYPIEIWKTKEASCNLEAIKISKLAFDNIPTGTPMTNTSVCNKMDLNPVLIGKLNELNKLKVGVVYGNDLAHGVNLATSVTMTSNIISTLGYMCVPGSIHLFLDNFWMEIGRGTNITYFGDVTIEHVHPLFQKAPSDNTYIEANSPEVWGADEATFKNYVATQLQDDLQKLRTLK